MRLVSLKVLEPVKTSVPEFNPERRRMDPPYCHEIESISHYLSEACVEFDGVMLIATITTPLYAVLNARDTGWLDQYIRHELRRAIEREIGNRIFKGA
ncbi:hypothetical protein QZM05_15930 [Burkholderia multivorans]|nr:hypothetical protein [Burkholderia multivorans]